MPRFRVFRAYERHNARPMSLLPAQCLVFSTLSDECQRLEQGIVVQFSAVPSVMSEDILPIHFLLPQYVERKPEVTCDILVNAGRESKNWGPGTNERWICGVKPLDLVPYARLPSPK
jgi:hypothetical protein